MISLLFKKSLRIAVLALAAGFVCRTPAVWAETQNQKLIVLCYHDIPKEVNLDDYGVDQRTFIETVEYFRRHHYTFISIDDLIKAYNGVQPLPEKSIMLTFDDGYRTYYDFVYPVLEEYKIPSTIAIVTSWIEAPPRKYVKNALMTWEQIKEVAHSPYVEVISHSDDLHKGVIYNPQGNEAAAGVSRVYEADQASYETEEVYRQRILADLKKSKEILETKTGKKVRAIAWPYGRYNHLMLAEAKKVGFQVAFTLNDQLADTKDVMEVERYLIGKNPTLKNLRRSLNLLPTLKEQKRVVQIDIDLIYDKDPTRIEANLGRLLDRIKAIAPSTVYVQAFSDPAGDGNIESVYFPNRVLPMKADLFNRVVHQLRTRSQVEVYAWMPMLSFVLPDKEQNDRLRVREKSNGEIRLGTSWYHRLSPFSGEAVALITTLYEDMATNAMFDGVIFQDDGYLTDYEDFHPDAIAAYKAKTGIDISIMDETSYKSFESWVRFKTDRLNALTDQLKQVVTRIRPESKFVRTLYAPAVMNEDSQDWLAQSYKDSLNHYDYVAIMAYPYMEDARKPEKWLKSLVRKAKQYDRSLEKTLFKIQTYDWKKDLWIDPGVADRWLNVLVAEGARHVGYYPDNYLLNRPDIAIIRRMISTEDFPFKRTWR